MVEQPETMQIIGTLPTSWRIADFGSLLQGGTRNGVYKPKEFHGDGVKIVNMGELFAHSRLGAVEMRRLNLDPEELAKSSLQSGDLLFARRSLVAEGAGKCSIVMEVDEPTTFESSIIRARPDPSQADPLYYYYLFASSFGVHLMGTILRQVAVSGITGTDLVRLRVPVPPLLTQRAIAGVLGALDDKIEVNRRMARTLEAAARALFESWFVRFEHPGGKAPAAPRLVDSAVGPIPVGWSVGTLRDVAKERRDGVTADAMDGSMHYIALEHMPRRSIALSDWSDAEGVVSNKLRFDTGDILFGKLRPYFHKVGVAPVSGICSTDMVVAQPVKPEWFGFVLGVMSSVDFVAHTDRGSAGTKMPRTNWTDMAAYRVAKPPVALAAEFTTLIHPMVDKIIAGIHENRALSAMRDVLLPRLISGELPVPEALGRAD